MIWEVCFVLVARGVGESAKSERKPDRFCEPAVEKVRCSPWGWMGSPDLGAAAPAKGGGALFLIPSVCLSLAPAKPGPSSEMENVSLFCQPTGTRRVSSECVEIPSPARVCFKTACSGKPSVLGGRARSEGKELSLSTQLCQALETLSYLL